MKFLNEKIKRFQEKKLQEAYQKLEFHKEIKNRMEDLLKTMNNGKSIKIQKKIEKQKVLIEIWKKNIVAIKKQLKIF